MDNHSRIISICTLLVLTLGVVACGGGGGGGGTSPTPATPPTTPPTTTVPTSPVVYLASQDTANVFNLYLADADNPGTSVQLNPPLPAGASIRFFDPSPDHSRVVYAADPDTLDKVELYTVELANPGVAIKLNPQNIPTDTDVQEFTFSPDSSQLVYAADQDTVGVREIYLLDFASPGVTTKLNSPQSPTGDVASGFQFSPDGTQVLYASDTDSDAQFELFLVDKNVPGVSVKVTAPFASFTNTLVRKTFSPDGNWIVYGADHDIDETFEMFLVATSNPGVATKLNPPLTADKDVCSWKFSADSMNVVYCADQDTDGVLELYAVQIASPGVSTKMNPPLVAGGNVRSDFVIGADSSFVVYRGDQETDQKTELYRVNLAEAGVATKLNADMIVLGDVFGFELRSDDLAVVYRADQTTDTEQELFEVELAIPGVSTRVHPQLVGADATAFLYSADGLRITYVAEQDTAGVFDLYSVDVANFGISSRINPPLVAGGEVTNILVP